MKMPAFASPARARDRATYGYYLSKMVLNQVRAAASMGPGNILKALEMYPWVRAMAGQFRLYDTLVGGRTGLFRKANALLLCEILSQVAPLLDNLVSKRDRLVLHEDMVPPEILFAMGLESWCTEFLGLMLPMTDPAIPQNYIDVCESTGTPPDVCSLPRHMMGLTLSGHMPRPAAMITSNSPCDGGMASYTVISRELEAPIFRLDMPYHFTSDRALDYLVNELESMISWLEEHTPGRMDWDRLAGICRERNRLQEAELAMWEMMRHRPAPMGVEPVYLSHIWCYYLRPGMPAATRLMEKLRDIAAKAVKKKEAAVEKERFRALLWGPFPIFFTDLWPWVEETFQVNVLMDSLSYNRFGFIDTGSKESMLRDLAKINFGGPMARHSRGPYENYFGDLFYAMEYFDMDMLWLAGHIGCKNAQALNGMLREKCRERKIPLLAMEYDLSDERIVSRSAVRNQINHFMENVMGVELPPPDGS